MIPIETLVVGTYEWRTINHRHAIRQCTLETRMDKENISADARKSQTGILIDTAFVVPLHQCSRVLAAVVAHFEHTFVQRTDRRVVVQLTDRLIPARFASSATMTQRYDAWASQ
jgi:hypothetical protein